MRKFNYIYLFAGLLLLATSCTESHKLVNTAPVNLQMNVTMADLDYVGEITGTATQSFFLTMPIGGRRFYYASQYVPGSFSIPFLGGGNRGINNALYDAMQQRPDADFIIPFNVEEKRNQGFLGRKSTYTVKAKAFKIKSK